MSDKNIFNFKKDLKVYNDKSVINLEKVVSIGAKDIELYLDFFIDGKEVISKRADSLLPNFLRVLMSFMGSNVLQSGFYYHGTDFGVSATMEGGTGWYDTITNVTAGATTTITKSNGALWPVGEYIQVYGVGGITPDINGLHQITGGTGANPQISVSTSGTFSNEGAFARKWIPNGSIRSNLDTFRASFIRVGRDGTANILDQQTMVNEWDPDEGPLESNELNYSAVVISQPALNYTNKTGEITFTIIITNNSGANLDIEEVGLYTEIENFGGFTDRSNFLIARDTIPTITLNDGTAGTINYRLRTNAQADGGFVDNFIKHIFTSFDQATSQTVVDIDGNSSSVSENDSKFMAVAPSGTGRVSVSLGGVEGNFVGLQIGTGNTAMAFDDFSLETRILHGSGSGEMLYHGTIVDNWQLSGSVASFDLTALFENQSGGNIGVKEMGLYTSNETASGSLIEIDMLSRHILPSTVTVTDGQILKVVYTIELNVDIT